MKLLTITQIHEGLFDVGEVLIRNMMFVASLGITEPFCKRLFLNIQFSQTVDNDMNVNVAAAVVTVCMGTD